MGNEWTSQLGGNLQKNEALTSAIGDMSLDDFANHYLETAGKVSELEGKTGEYEGKITDLQAKLDNSIPKLGENATDEDRAAFLKALGVPESADGYEFKPVEGVENDPKMMDWAKQAFFKHGVPKEAGEAIAQEFNHFIQGLEKELIEQDKQASVEANEALKKNWGAEYDKNVEFARRARDLLAERLSGLGEFLKTKNIHGDAFGDNPAAIELFYLIGKAVGEDFVLRGRQPGETKESSDGFSYPNSPEPPKKE